MISEFLVDFKFWLILFSRNPPAVWRCVGEIGKWLLLCDLVIRLVVGYWLLGACLYLFGNFVYWWSNMK
jgi:hypothetical protein